MINIKEKEYCNYQPNLTGKGLKIAFMEYNASEWFVNKNIGNPLNHPTTSLFGEDDGKLTHSYKCASVIRDMLPDAQIDFLPQIDAGLKYAIDNNYHIISASIGNCLGDDTLEKKLSQKSFMVISAGNEGSKGENISARNDWWFAVTAFHLNNDIVTFPSYSSYGFGKVQCGSFADIQYEEDSPHEWGTSVSQPFLVGLLGQYYEAYHLKFGFYPTIEQAKAFISLHSKKVLNDPLKEGNGLFTLPSNLMSDYQFGTAISEKYGNKINVNGTWKQTVNPPMIVNNKLMVELTILRDCVGNKVYWNQKENCAIISK